MFTLTQIRPKLHKWYKLYFNYSIKNKSLSTHNNIIFVSHSLPNTQANLPIYGREISECAWASITIIRPINYAHQIHGQSNNRFGVTRHCHSTACRLPRCLGGLFRSFAFAPTVVSPSPLAYQSRTLVALHSAIVGAELALIYVHRAETFYSSSAIGTWLDVVQVLVPIVAHLVLLGETATRPGLHRRIVHEVGRLEADAAKETASAVLAGVHRKMLVLLVLCVATECAVIASVYKVVVLYVLIVNVWHIQWIVITVIIDMIYAEFLVVLYREIIFMFSAGRWSFWVSLNRGKILSLSFGCAKKLLSETNLHIYLQQIAEQIKILYSYRNS